MFGNKNSLRFLPTKENSLILPDKKEFPENSRFFGVFPVGL